MTPKLIRNCCQCLEIFTKLNSTVVNAICRRVGAHADRRKDEDIDSVSTVSADTGDATSTARAGSRRMTRGIVAAARNARDHVSSYQSQRKMFA